MEEVLTVRNEYRMKQWAELVRSCRESGLSNREFCCQNGISEKTYYYWLRKLRRASYENEKPQLVRMEAPEEQKTVNGTILLRYKEAELEIHSGTDCESITAVLQAMKNI